MKIALSLLPEVRDSCTMLRVLIGVLAEAISFISPPQWPVRWLKRYEKEWTKWNGMKSMSSMSTNNGTNVVKRYRV